MTHILESATCLLGHLGHRDIRLIILLAAEADKCGYVPEHSLSAFDYKNNLVFL